MVTAKRRTGMITGKPKTAIKVEELVVLAAMEEIMVKPEDKPIDPRIRLRRKRLVFAESEGKGRKMSNRSETTNTSDNP